MSNESIKHVTPLTRFFFFRRSSGYVSTRQHMSAYISIHWLSFVPFVLQVLKGAGLTFLFFLSGLTFLFFLCSHFFLEPFVLAELKVKSFPGLTFLRLLRVLRLQVRALKGSKKKRLQKKSSLHSASSVSSDYR
jgi:hypothetical protein